MPAPTIPDIHSPRYQLQGECGRCGACCQLEECEHLSFDGETAVCAIYDSRPDMCKNWPAAPPVMIATCAYRFKDSWDNNRTLNIKEV